MAPAAWTAINLLTSDRDLIACGSRPTVTGVARRTAGAIGLAAVLVTAAAGCSVPAHPATRPAVATAGPAGSPGAGGSSGGLPPATAPARSPMPATPSGSPRRVKALAGKVITIDPGHNGANWSHPQVINRLVNVLTEWKACDTTGTQTDSGYAEHAFTFDVAMRLARLLRGEGATVVLTRTNDHGVGPCITTRARIGNRAHSDAAISIHADGGPAWGSGFEVIEPGRIPGGYDNAVIGPSRRLGLDVRNTYHRITGEPYSDYVGHDGIDVRTDLGGLNLSTVPKVFIECANMRNAGDAARLTDPRFRQRIAVALAAGLTRFLTSP